MLGALIVTSPGIRVAVNVSRAKPLADVNPAQLAAGDVKPPAGQVDRRPGNQWVNNRWDDSVVLAAAN